MKITSNGRYILAPTIYGQIFVFNILTGQLTAILKEHEGKKSVSTTIVSTTIKTDRKRKKKY